ncbi:MerR family transcriptional regulator [Clostridium ljungdahlii]|uniref:MerR family transcriptional regulator n=1 Tax=Clostridium ljungdahlii TaxID=1538 RepID=UPI003866CE04
MNIKAAAEKTGLTKKAIKYYESEGLINPLKNVENNYREYSDEDIIRLNLIGALRSLDIPIKGIKDVIAGKKGLQEALMDALEKIDENISYLEKSKLIISSLMEKNPDDYKYSGEQIKKLRETLELSRDNKKELISNSLLRIFPGNFGKMFAVMYEPFLEVKIDNDEKKKVWLKLVEFLDSAEEVDESDYPIEELKDLDDDKLDEFRTTIGNQVKKLLNYDDSIKNTTVNNQIEFVKSLKEDEEAKCSFIRCIELTKSIVR